MLNNAKEKKKDLKIIMFEFKVFKTFLGGAGAGTAFFRIRLHSNKGRFVSWRFRLHNTAINTRVQHNFSTQAAIS